MVAALKADPVNWYKANKLNSAAVAAEKVEIEQEEEKEEPEHHHAMMREHALIEGPESESLKVVAPEVKALMHGATRGQSLSQWGMASRPSGQHGMPSAI
jgi:hypothetical protein